MKRLYLFLPLFLIIVSCSSDDENYVIIDGRVQRAIDGNGIANQSVTVMTRKLSGFGLFSSYKNIDSKEVITDENGNFSIALMNEVDAFVSIAYEGDDDYFGSGIFRDYSIDEPVILNVDKFIKFKIFVNNTNPFDESDFIHVDFFAGLSGVVRTGIDNFGVDNISYPEEVLPGGGIIGARETTSWYGVDVNSIVYYSVRESAERFKIRWYMKKNGVETDGFTDDIPYYIDQVNSFSFHY